MSLTPEQIDILANKYLVDIFQEMEQDVISDIARRVRKTGRLTETAELMAQNMMNQGFSPAEIRRDVMKYIKADAALQAQIATETLEYKAYVAERIRGIVDEAKEAGNELVAGAGTMCFNDDLALWKEAGKKLEDTALPQIVEAVQKQTWGTMKNLTKTTALGLRSADGTKVDIMDAYHKFLDKATLQVATGTFSFDEAANRVVKEMAKSGIRYIEYNSENGRTTMTELDVAVRRNVRTGLAQMSGRIMEENIKNSDTDLVITSQHMGSRPEHAEWQNKVFSFSGKDKRYKTLEEGTGYGTVTGLKGANCSHNFYPYWPGISVKEPDLEEPSPVEINGREYTYYQATQKQRYYERNLRALKREALVQENSGGDPVEVAKIKNQARAMSREYNSFSKAAGLKPKPNRARVVGVDRGSPKLSFSYDLDIPDGTKKAIEKLPKFGNKGKDGKRIGYLNPITFADADENAKVNTLMIRDDYESLVSKATPTAVNVNDIITNQSWVSRAKLEGILSRGVYTETSDNLPLAVNMDGKIYLLDGNHRVVVQKMMGRQMIFLDVFKL